MGRIAAKRRRVLAGAGRTPPQIPDAGIGSLEPARDAANVRLFDL